MIDAPTGISAFLAAGAQQLRTAGIEQPVREVWWIWEKLSGRPRTFHLTREAETVPETLALQVAAAVTRRAAGEPLAYILGEAAFRHLVLRSDGRALIPRPETEGLVDLVLERQRTGSVADIGTGTGCIALSLASEGAYDLVAAVERSPASRALARANIETTRLPVRLIAGDLCQCLRDAQVDVLVSNPPYLTEAEYASLPGEVREWEPEAALRSGVDGMDATLRLVIEGRRVVRRGGWLMLEVDCARAEQVALAAGEAGWSDVLVQDDLFGRARYVVARRSE